MENGSVWNRCGFGCFQTEIGGVFGAQMQFMVRFMHVAAIYVLSRMYIHGWQKASLWAISVRPFQDRGLWWDVVPPGSLSLAWGY